MANLGLAKRPRPGLIPGIRRHKAASEVERLTGLSGGSKLHIVQIEQSDGKEEAGAFQFTISDSAATSTSARSDFPGCPSDA